MLVLKLKFFRFYIRLIGKEVKSLYSPRYCNVDGTLKYHCDNKSWEGEKMDDTKSGDLPKI